MAGSTRIAFLATPVRVLDTKNAVGGSGPVSAGTVVSVQVGGIGSIPSEAVGVIGTLACAEASVDGSLVVFPSDAPGPPPTSNLYFWADGRPIADAVVTPLGARQFPGQLSIQVNASSTGDVQLILDVVAWLVV
jgi:hypothetical protein